MVTAFTGTLYFWMAEKTRTCSQVCNHELNDFLHYYLQTVPLNINNSTCSFFVKENCIKIKAKTTYSDIFQMHQWNK